MAGHHGDLAHQAQNPIADLISLPFQNNTTFGVGPGDDALNVLNIQPVIPFKLGDLNVITRTILPVIYQPEIVPGTGSEFGLGDAVITAFLSPAEPKGIVWGVGPVLLLPTSTSSRLGAGEWGAGAGAVALIMKGPWVAGGLAQQVWSFEGAVNQLLIQPFINYNLSNGWYLVTAPIITANWNADSSNTWTVPIGFGAGRVFKVGKQPINASVQVYYNAERPDTYGEWTLRIQFQLLFPKGK